MSFAIMIANIGIRYHASLVDLGNSLNQLGLLSDKKAEEFCMIHTIETLEAGARKYGMSLERFLEVLNKEES